MTSLPHRIQEHKRPSHLHYDHNEGRMKRWYFEFVRIDDNRQVMRCPVTGLEYKMPM